MAVYAPLARQALANSERLGIAQALTGPLLRGDVGTLKGHLAVLKEHAPERCRSTSRWLDARWPSPSDRGELAPDGRTRSRICWPAPRQAGRLAVDAPSSYCDARRNELANIRSNAQQSRGYPGRPAHHQVRDTDCSAPRSPPGHPPHHSGAPRPVTDRQPGDAPARCHRSAARALGLSIRPAAVEACHSSTRRDRLGDNSLQRSATGAPA